MAESSQQQTGSRRWLASTAVMLVACGVAAWWLSSATPQVESARLDSPNRPGVRSRNASPSLPAVVVPTVVQRLLAEIAAPVAEGSGAGDEAAVTRLAGALAPDDGPEGLGYLLRPDGLAAERDWGVQLLRRWAEACPTAAAAWLDGQPDLAGRDEAVDQVATAWAGQDLEAASRWAGQLPAAERQRVLTAVLYEGAGNEPTLAMTLAIRGLPACPERDELLRYAAAQWASAEPAAAWAWAGQLTDPSLRDPIVATVAMEWSESDPVAGATLAVEQLPAGRLQNDALVSIVERWVQVDPRAASDWVATGFPEGELRGTAATELMKIWAERDMMQAGNWLAELEPGPLADAALDAYVRKLLLYAPGIAADLTEWVTDRTAREGLAAAVMDEWMKRDAPLARAWVSSSTLSVSLKDQLLK